LNLSNFENLSNAMLRITLFAKKFVRIELSGLRFNGGKTHPRYDTNTDNPANG
jgi:hypothetical protein